jgi:hypothetical protein
MVHEQNNQQNAKIKDLTPWFERTSSSSFLSFFGEYNSTIE